ncbi:MAG: V-type ATP synthase subunit D [Mariprofundaceae bacterium]|nr:V-type ATP synthase subunit D [Mariprofundaceae bacterium]
MAAHRRPVTKAELVRIREELKLSQTGLELLERKRDSLMAKGLQLLRQARTQRENLTREWGSLMGMWDDTLRHERFERLKALAANVPRLQPPEGGSRHWMSVELAEFRCEIPALGLLGAVSDCGIRPEQVRAALAGLVPELLQLMCTETNLRRISRALKQCQRQVNALEQLLIPELRSEQRQIEQRLEEKEREAVFQSKRLKARKHETV